MSEQAAHLVDRILPRAPYRQWVLTLPWDLARRVAFDASLCAAVFAIFADTLSRWHCDRAIASGVAAPSAGCVLEVQRFADGARLYPHAHALAPQGVFSKTNDGRISFQPVHPPKRSDVLGVAQQIEGRVRRLLATLREFGSTEFKRRNHALTGAVDRATNREIGDFGEDLGNIPASAGHHGSVSHPGDRLRKKSVKTHD